MQFCLRHFLIVFLSVTAVGANLRATESWIERHGAPAKLVSLSCLPVKGAETVFQKVFLNGEMMKAGKLVLFLNQGEARAFKVRMAPANPDGSGILAVVIERMQNKWILDLKYDDKTHEGVITPSDSNAPKYFFNCQ